MLLNIMSLKKQIKQLVPDKLCKHGSYAYYHLLSVVDFPLQLQDYIHAYCAAHAGAEFIGFAQNVTGKKLHWHTNIVFFLQGNSMLPVYGSGFCVFVCENAGYNRVSMYSEGSSTNKI